MASIQHKSIPDAQLHEPKGIITAPSGYVYRSNGTGSGVWAALPSVVAGYAGLAFNGNTTAFTMAAASNPNLNVSADYSLVTGAAAPFSIQDNEGGVVTSGTGSFIATVSGIYRVEVLGAISAFPTATARVALKYIVNGSSLGPRKYLAASPIASYQGPIVGSDLVALSATNTLQLAVASTAAGSLTFEELSFRVTLVRAL